MEQIKELTKRLIANSFKELMLQSSFDKITIKMITDHASVIRPTFYNHFHDKYELVDWIVQEEIIRPVRDMFEQGNGAQAVRVLFSGFYKDRLYYRKAFEITGQNGFYDMLLDDFSNMFAFMMDENCNDEFGDLLPRYYASGLITTIRFMIYEAGDIPLDKIIEKYGFMMQHSIYDVLK